MRLATRALLFTIVFAIAVREGGNPNSDDLALELGTEVAMTVEGPLILPVLVPTGIARRCSLPTISRPGALDDEMIAAVVNRAAECSLLEAVEAPNHVVGNVR
jgi:hypothetical protein